MLISGLKLVAIEELVALFRRHKPDLVINVALPYQDLTIMDALVGSGGAAGASSSRFLNFRMTRSATNMLKAIIRKSTMFFILKDIIMSKVIIIGAGGVGTVVAHKCAQNPGVFTEIVLGRNHNRVSRSSRLSQNAHDKPTAKSTRSEPHP